MNTNYQVSLRSPCSHSRNFVVRGALRKIPKRTNGSERPQVPGTRPAYIPEIITRIVFGTSDFGYLQRAKWRYFEEFFVAQGIFLCYFLLLPWTKESREQNHELAWTHTSDLGPIMLCLKWSILINSKQISCTSTDQISNWDSTEICVRVAQRMRTKRAIKTANARFE